MGVVTFVVTCTNSQGTGMSTEQKGFSSLLHSYSRRLSLDASRGAGVLLVVKESHNFLQ